MVSGNGGKSTAGLKNKLIDLKLSEEQVQDILSRRAVVLARVPDQADGISAVSQYVTFRLGTERYAIEVALVEEIQTLKDLTLIPCTPNFVAGAVNIRGSILPVIDLKKFFGIPDDAIREAVKVIVIRVDEITMGVLADSVEEVVDLAADDLEPHLATLSGLQEEFIKGVASTEAIVLDMAALAKDKRMVIHDDL